MLTLLIFLIILGLLVVSHEFGHFVAARKSGMKVYEFGFGFPPRAIGIQVLKKKFFVIPSTFAPLSVNSREESLSKITNDGQSSLTAVRDDNKKKWRVVWGSKKINELPPVDGYEAGTIYSFNWIPLGGFVKIKGEEGEELGPDSFVTQKAWKKAVTLAAGVLMNVVLAAILLSIGFMVGLPQAINDSFDPARVKNRNLQIMAVLPNMPAQSAGFKAGDIVISLDAVVNPGVRQMQDYIGKNKDREVEIKIKRGSEIIVKKVKPALYTEMSRASIGVQLVEIGIIRYPWYKAIWEGIIATGLYLKEIILAFYSLLKGLFAGAPVGESLSGPVGIAVMTGQVAKLGWAYLINFTAVLSLNLAILNILPIPALDGGRLLFLAIGGMFRRQLSLKFEQFAHMLGFILLMLLVVIVTVKDVSRFKGVFSNLFSKFF